MDKETKTQAELYREQRKERLAKAAEKKAKKSPKFSRAKKRLGKVIAVILVVALCLGAVGGILNFFGTPQRLIKISVADKKLSFTMAEFNYYYFDSWNNVYAIAYQNEQNYAQYGYGEGGGKMATGYDYEKSPSSQEYKSEYEDMVGVKIEDLHVKEGKTPMWDDVIKYLAVRSMIIDKYGALKAKEAGLEITEDQQNEIDDQIESIREKAAESDYSLDRYLRNSFGNGINEKVFRTILEQSSLSTTYFTKVKDDLENSTTEKDLEAKYKEHPENYNIVTTRLYQFTTDIKDDADDDAIKAAYKETKAKADEFKKAVTDEKSFVDLAAAAIKSSGGSTDTDADEATLCDNYKKADFDASSEKMGEWVFSKDRKVGDVGVFDIGDGTYSVVMMVELPHKDKSPVSSDVRHILFKFPDPDGTTTDSKGNSVVSDAQKRATKAEAEKILEEYKKDPTEKNFIALTNKHTDDVDSDGKPNNGGLYENVTKDGQYAKPFTNWALDTSHKSGDVEIIESDYGYHIMYFVKASGEQWSDDIKNEIISDANQKIYDQIQTKYIDTFNYNNCFLKIAQYYQNKMFNNYLTNKAR
ncbi:MAG: peptidyl-prolyl cis-trans isomerase [Clostridiales bacterium]|nr:peptidyl-prolyl cis-trans isomerase [Clostridiales bacterium]